MKKIAVILHGCGVNDGTEIHEAVCTMLGLQRHGAELSYFAPDLPQARVVNHLTDEVVESERSMLQEAARIARGDIKVWTQCVADDFDGLVIPGGTGTAFNLCDFAMAGENMKVHDHLSKLLVDFQKKGKPIGAVCIAPVIVAKVFGEQGVKVTIGTDEGVASKVKAMGAVHVDCEVDDCVVDETLKIVTTPAYMLGKNAFEISKGIGKLADELLRLA